MGEMGKYIEFVSDHLLVSLGCQKHYGTQNPFEFMELISLQGKTNFFEKRVGEYAKAGVATATAGGNHVFSLGEDFERSRREETCAPLWRPIPPEFAGRYAIKRSC